MEETVKVTLEPRGKFVLELSTGQFIKGWFSMNALNLFCEQHGDMNYIELLGKITAGMKLKDYADLVVLALQEYYREDVKQCGWNAQRVMDEIFEFIQPGTPEFIGWMKHAIGRVVNLDVLPDEDEDGEKKN